LTLIEDVSLLEHMGIYPFYCLFMLLDSEMFEIEDESNIGVR
jgi:hypothetical protein